MVYFERSWLRNLNHRNFFTTAIIQNPHSVGSTGRKLLFPLSPILKLLFFFIWVVIISFRLTRRLVFLLAFWHIDNLICRCYLRFKCFIIIDHNTVVFLCLISVMWFWGVLFLFCWFFFGLVDLLYFLTVSTDFRRRSLYIIEFIVLITPYLSADSTSDAHEDIKNISIWEFNLIYFNTPNT